MHVGVSIPLKHSSEEEISVMESSEALGGLYSVRFSSPPSWTQPTDRTPPRVSFPSAIEMLSYPDSVTYANRKISDTELLWHMSDTNAFKRGFFFESDWARGTYLFLYKQQRGNHSARWWQLFDYLRRRIWRRRARWRSNCMKVSCLCQ